jgi:L-aspartate oxidase
MGGVRTDLWGRTSLPGLLAVGEVACNGLHGANRLASNSLLEGAVYGRRVVEAAVAAPRAADDVDESWAAPVLVPPADTDDPLPLIRTDLQRLLWDTAGLRRDEVGLRHAVETLQRVDTSVPSGGDVKAVEDANLRTVARALVVSALERRESRGGHFRIDAPAPGPVARHSAVVLARTTAPRRVGATAGAAC